MSDPKKTLAKNYRELTVRSRVVKGMANIYMERHVHDLGGRPRVLKLLKTTVENRPDAWSTDTTLARVREHVEARVDAEYPPAEFGSEDGAVPLQIREMLEAGDADARDQSADQSAFEMKQSTMPDMPAEGADLFQGVRPALVVDEGEARGTFSREAVTESAARDKTSVVDVSTSNSFENQFTSSYNCRVFPWALNYDCGGPDYPDLFADWSWLESTIAERQGSGAGELRERWRRVQGEAPLLPGDYAKMLACRPEMQIAGD